MLNAALDTSAQILERCKKHDDNDYKQIVYGLRLTVANVLGFDSTANLQRGQDGRFPDVVNKTWEEGRHNSITANTHIQVKSLVFAEPEIKWSECIGQNPEITSEIRTAYYLSEWRKQNWAYLYQQKLLDILVSGSGYTHLGVRDGKPFMEWADSLDVIEDNSFREEHKKRFRCVDKHLPLVEALRLYPQIEKQAQKMQPNGAGGEQIVTIRCYYSKTTTAVLFKNQIVDGPKPTMYPNIPVRKASLIHNLSAKFASGMVEGQIGTHRLDLRLQRYFRETVLRGTPVALAVGRFDEHELDDVRDSVEGAMLRSLDKDADFRYTQGAEIQKGALELDEMVKQAQNAESGVNDFQRNQTDTKVDFASQLAYIAQQSGVQGQFTAQAHEEGIKDDARAYLELAAKFEDGPVTLSVDGHSQKFDQFFPIGAQLGSDGEVDLKPTAYKSPAQKLQEVMILGQVLNIGNTLPPGMQDWYWEECLEAFNVDEKDKVMADMQQARAEMMQQQQEAAMMQAMPQQMGPQQTGAQKPPQQAGPPVRAA